MAACVGVGFATSGARNAVKQALPTGPRVILWPMGIRSRVALFAVGLFAACGDNLEPEQDIDSSVVIELDTSAPTQVKAGEMIAVTCTLLENGITTMVAADVRVVAEENIFREGKAVMARKVGVVEVSCALPGRGLVDPTPALVEIVHGTAANVVTTVTPDPVVAGNSVAATCVVYDGFGNIIEDGDEPSLSVSPIDAGNELTGLTAFMTRAGHYTARCDLPGTSTNNAGFDVIPNLPASIVLARWPDLPIYAVGSIVDVTHIVSDRYGNEILEPSVIKTVTPTVGPGPAVHMLAGQWRYDGEGRYTVLATVDGPTDMNVALSASVEILVNSRGPAISCIGDASMINMTPGGTYTVNGNANDANGVQSLTVNGSAVTVANDGSFSANISTRFGINFVDITALDTFDQPTTKVCTFLVSNRYGVTQTPIADTVSLKLTQNAVDDGNRTNGLNSLDDILYAIINSAGLSNTLHNSLLAANPIKPSSCDSQTCTFLGCVCWASSGVTYLDRDLPGTNTVSLQLVPNGLTANVYIPNPAVRLNVAGRIAGIPYNSTGWVRFSYVSVGLTLDLAIVNSRPKITVRPGSVTADVGTVTTDFNGVDGWIIDNIIVPLAQGYIRDLVRNIIRDFVTNNFNAALDGVIGSLDINTLGATFNVPRIDGSGNVPMSFGLGFSSVATSSTRVLFGIGTRFSTTAANAFPTLGVALPPTPNVLSDPSIVSPANTAVAAHVGVLNGALHALWRANYFSATVSGTTIPGLPAGVSFVLNTRLPPIALISAASIPQLQFGAMDLTVIHPSLPPNLSVTLGADAHATVNLVGNDLVFGGVVIDALHVSTDAINLTPQQQMDLETVLLTLLQDLVNQSLNDVLPAIPIPSFTLPASLSTFGLPAGARLGIVTPTLTTTPQHFTLRGRFGVQ